MIQKCKELANKWFAFCKTGNVCGILVISVITYCLLFALNQVTEFRGDDLIMMFIAKTGKPIESFRDVIDDTIDYYITWGGRITAGIIVRTLVWWQKPYSSILNALVIAILNAMVWVYGKRKSFFTLIITTTLMYFLNADFDGTCNWITGSACYIWPMLVCLAFLWPYIRLFEDDFSGRVPVLKALIMAALGVIAGCSTENIGPVVFFLAVAVLILRKGKRIPLWSITGAIGALGGVAVMLLAPGNSLRQNSIEAENNFLRIMILRGYYMERAVFIYLLPTLLLVVALLLVIIYFYHERPDIVSILFIGAGIVSVGGMLLSPTYPPRATVGSMIFFLVAIMRMLNKVVEKEKKIYCIICLVGTFGYIAFVAQLLTQIGYMVMKGVSFVPSFI